MTLNVEIPPELEQSLAHAAQQQGIAMDELVVSLLRQGVQPISTQLTPEQRAAKLEAMFAKWNEEAQEDEGDGSDFFEAMDANRDGYRKLFPPELKGITW